MTESKPGEIRHPDAHGSVMSAILFLLAGPILWAGHLALIYGPQATLCSFGLQGAGGWRVVLFILVISLAVLVPQLFLLLRPHVVARMLRYRSAEPGGKAFAYSVSRLLTGLSMLGVLFSGAMPLALDACGLLR